MKKHLPDQISFECPQCFKSFTTKSNLNKHLRILHRGNVDETTKTSPNPPTEDIQNNSRTTTTNIVRQVENSLSPPTEDTQNKTIIKILRRVDYNKTFSTKSVGRNLSPSSQIKIRKCYCVERPLIRSEPQEDALPTRFQSVDDECYSIGSEPKEDDTKQTLYPPIVVEECPVEDAANSIEILQTDQIEKSPNDYMPIKSNVYFAIIMRKETPLCHCKPTDDCVDFCLNQMMAYECTEKCVCGVNCKNSAIRKGNTVSVETIKAHDKGGVGVKINSSIDKGTFIMEYVGEVIHKSTYEERVKSIYADDKHTYAVDLGDQLIIDAHRKGNICRYVNHSCNPNCNMERWIVNGLPCLGLFSNREIQKGEELTFNYRLHLFNFDENPKCKCGSKNCQGLLAKPKNTTNRKPETKKETSKQKCVESPASEVIDLTEMDDLTVITSSAPELRLA